MVPRQKRRQQQDGKPSVGQTVIIQGGAQAKRRPKEDLYQIPQSTTTDYFDEREEPTFEELPEFAGFLGSSGEEADADDECETDYHLYDDEADPSRDDDDPCHHENENQDTCEHETAGTGFLEPAAPIPAIVLDWAGDRMEVKIPLEAYLDRISSNEFLGKKTRDLRTIGQTILERNDDLFLEPVFEMDNFRTKIKRIAQVELIKRLGADVSKHKGPISHLIKNEYLQTLSTGIIPLSWFFFTQEEREETAIIRRITPYLQQVVDAEIVNAPLDNRAIWDVTRKHIEEKEQGESKDKLLTVLANAKKDSFKTLRNWLKEEGIPLTRGRKHIYDKVMDYVMKEKPKFVSVSEILSLKNKLIGEYGLFTGQSSGRGAVAHYDKEAFNAFVNLRIRKILELNGIQMTEV